MRRKKASKNVFRNPVIIAIFSSALGVLGIIAGKIWDSTIQATQQKNKLESDLILQSVNVDDPDARLHNLEFIMRLGLISQGI